MYGEKFMLSESETQQPFAPCAAPVIFKDL
jgi:hypothetical protein